jgi:hypothetical protein
MSDSSSSVLLIPQTRDRCLFKSYYTIVLEGCASKFSAYSHQSPHNFSKVSFAAVISAREWYHREICNVTWQRPKIGEFENS